MPVLVGGPDDPLFGVDSSRCLGDPAHAEGPRCSRGPSTARSGIDHGQASMRKPYSGQNVAIDAPTKNAALSRLNPDSW